MNILKYFILTLVLLLILIALRELGLYLLNTLRFIILQWNCQSEPNFSTQYLGL